MKINQFQLETLNEHIEYQRRLLDAQIKQLRMDYDKLLNSHAALEKQYNEIVKRLDIQVEILNSIPKRIEALDARRAEHTKRLLRRLGKWKK